MQPSTYSRPFVLKQYEALLRRLPFSHSSRPQIDSDYQKFKAGFAGEHSLSYYLPYLQEKAAIIQGLRLPSTFSDHYFQIDLLLLFPSFIYIGEVKHMNGTLDFDVKNGQLLRTNSEGQSGFSCPVAQVDRQKRELAKWLEAHGYPRIPIEADVIVSHEKAVIRDEQCPEKVYHSARMLYQLEEYMRHHTKRMMTKDKQRKLIDTLQKMTTEKRLDLLSRYQISVQEILRPFPCAACGARDMTRRRGRWQCRSCRNMTKTAHLYYLQDLSCLLESPIKKKELMSLLYISSRATLNRTVNDFWERSNDPSALKSDDIERHIAHIEKQDRRKR
ncbi:NERD domain-containing protein [Alkalicoccus urumqiensis]|uniref:NERD domain-containing protein n=1 Tax=Alkalicoccus urumqiensis TaxID=1548213 RepID=A0A2P6MHB5_ALKUR|nr:NERD domain-containing protein [Alkalicoccus urumqiensis]PRO65668.1 hypothetical protein C6I21_09095 [Alkalicoccus urumqiensis]